LEKKIKPGKTKTKTQTLDMARFKKKNPRITCNDEN
jgi:hypothetical protein